MPFTYLALGDSYTIGELVPLYESFPYQALQILRHQFKGAHEFFAPEIVAKTGWTTDELSEQISKTEFLSHYDFVSLLIGVNNQYRGRMVDNYRDEFEALLEKAIHFAGGNPQRVFVLSIPDWGVTPFAAERDALQIAMEIDAYNDACKQISRDKNCHFIDITASQRVDGAMEDYLATDKLHPSGKEYRKWAIQLAESMVAAIKNH